MYDNYVRLLTKIDAFVAHIRERHPYSFKCGPGCTTCCVGGITVWRVEFDHIKECLQKGDLQITDHPPLERRRAGGSRITKGPCPFLDGDGHCSIYEARPVVCRLWGTPLMIPRGREHEWGLHPSHSTPSSNGTITCCDLNFQGGMRLENLTLVDAVNADTVIQTLAAINHVYCKARGLDPTERIPIASIQSG